MTDKEKSDCMWQFMTEIEIDQKYLQWMSSLGKAPKEWINLLPKAIIGSKGKDYGRLIVINKEANETKHK